MKTLVWDMYYDVYGVRPEHFTDADWNNSDFLIAEIKSLEAIMGSFTRDEMVANSFSEVEADEDCDDGDDAYALASAGWGTDEDYGYAEDVL